MPRGAVLLTGLVFLLGIVYLYQPSFDLRSNTFSETLSSSPSPGVIISNFEPKLTADLVQYFEDYPLVPPYKDRFGELGRRTRLLRDLLESADSNHVPSQRSSLLDIIDKTALLLFPFLRGPPTNSNSAGGLTNLRSSIEPGSVGIVIPAGNNNVRFAAHLISSLRNVLNSRLPIQIVYAGDRDLSASNRHFLAELVASSGQALDFLDILTVFDDSTLKLQEGGWAIKPFAVLGSNFEKIVLLDSDAVFLQKPEVLLDHSGFQHTGALLFRDRLLWQHAFSDRHQWWHSQIKRPSDELNTSLVWTQEYAEEGDSGVVVVDKSRTDVFMGLLHICWQNSYDVREEVTYKITYGDKETWWMGFELAGSSYEMEKHYGAIVGWETELESEAENREDNREQRDDPSTKKVCSFVIAHVDEQENLIWYNGGLLKNKKIPEMKHDYAVPDKWMVDGEWQKGATREDMSCMVGEQMHDLSDEQMRRLERSIAEAKRIDVALHVD
ncbi:hypothetical protein J7T55_014913 [Diaporthe amygdali]|uniref:uncharacterized protein n=1 Tax=Phomopsis amygdali TaxID=1214568 RepID=UPI0022FDF3F7|nr:uncharacterized protein J7T55_014913 [Diaporthe amygdali]KAJ0106838.1 hypothetical protein J7T55_014913 [Diaporthe amygdali]